MVFVILRTPTGCVRRFYREEIMQMWDKFIIHLENFGTIVEIFRSDTLDVIDFLGIKHKAWK